ncbi:MAG: hypothetical protein KAJ51_07010, partial [Thermoplasmata archaeon]|nr:hypothetical protein [Thermoplasmata archaeon]
MRDAYVMDFNTIARYSSGERPSNDWNAWEKRESVNAICSDNEIETQIYLATNSDVNARAHLINSNNDFDMSDVVLSSEPGALLIEQQSISPKVIESSEDLDETPIMIELNLNAYCRDMTLDDIEFNHEVELFETVTDDKIEFPITIKESEEKIIAVKPVLSPDAASGKVFELETTGARVDKGSVTITGNSAKSYVGIVPPEIEIDGLFEDWVPVEKVTDFDKYPIDNPNIDISSYAHATSDDAVSFYLRVEGMVLQGTELPSESYIYHPRKPHSNIGTVTVGTNTVNPIQDLPIKTGEDSVCIFLDIDNDYTTGYSPYWFPIGADYMIEVHGQNRKILMSSYYRFNQVNGQIDWSWTDSLGSLDAAIDSSQFEAQIPFDKLNTSDIPSIYYHIVDWKHTGDYSDDPIMGPSQAKKGNMSNYIGTRGVTTYLLINEIFPYDYSTAGGQWIEVANPTGSAAGSGYDIYNFDTSTVIVNIILNIGAGGFWSYNPSTAFSAGDTLQLRDASDNVVDNVTVPTGLGNSD